MKWVEWNRNAFLRKMFYFMASPSTGHAGPGDVSCSFDFPLVSAARAHRSRCAIAISARLALVGARATWASENQERQASEMGAILEGNPSHENTSKRKKQPTDQIQKHHYHPQKRAGPRPSDEGTLKVPPSKVSGGLGRRGWPKVEWGRLRRYLEGGGFEGTFKVSSTFEGGGFEGTFNIPSRCPVV